MGQEQDKKPVRRRIPADAKITGPVPQPNPFLQWIAQHGDQLIGGAETIAGFFDSNPGPEILKAISIVPPAAARKFGAGLLEKVAGSGQFSDELIGALKLAQQKYPRLFGHIRSVQPPIKDFAPYSGQQGAGWRGSVMSRTKGDRSVQSPGWEEVIPYLPNKKRAEAAMNTSSVGFKSRPDSPIETVHHELAHVAQQLRKGAQFEDAYRTADDLVGYVKNPYEVRARQAGARAVLRNPGRESLDPTFVRPAGSKGSRELDAVLTPEERQLEQVFHAYTKELRDNNWTVTPRASELWEQLQKLGKGSRKPGRPQLGMDIFGDK